MTIADRARQRAMLDALFDELPPDAKVTMLAADWDVSPIVEDAGAAGWPEALAKIDAIPSAGGLHLERALREAAERARKTGAGAVLFVGHRRKTGSRATAWPRRWRVFRNAGVRLSVVEVGAGEVPRRARPRGRRDGRRGDRRCTPSRSRCRSSPTRSARGPAIRRSTRAARASGTCSGRSPATPSGSDARWIRRSRRTPRRPAPTPARRWRSISRRCGIARASSGTTATPRTRSRRCSRR